MVKLVLVKSYSSLNALASLPQIHQSTPCTECHWLRGVKTSCSKSSTSMPLTRHIKAQKSPTVAAGLPSGRLIERRLLLPGNERMTRKGMDLARYNCMDWKDIHHRTKKSWNQMLQSISSSKFCQPCYVRTCEQRASEMLLVPLDLFNPVIPCERSEIFSLSRRALQTSLEQRHLQHRNRYQEDQNRRQLKISLGY